MSWLFTRVAYGHLFYIGANVEALYIVGVVEVVAKVILGEIKRNEKARVIGRKTRCSDKRDREFGTVKAMSAQIILIGIL